MLFMLCMFAFHPKLKFNMVIIEIRFGHSIVKLTILNFLTREQLMFKDDKTLLQVRDCASNVAAKNNSMAISEMFSMELKFVAGCLLGWFSKKK